LAYNLNLYRIECLVQLAKELHSGLRGNDTLIRVNPLSATPGSNETDVLIGGRGRDVFVLGDATKTYYSGTGFVSIQYF
jgi:Ca2+-binding RTX toxin-like protein